MTGLTIQIPSELFAPAESSHFEGAFDLPVFKSGPDFYSFDEPLEWRIDITNVGDALLLEGIVEGSAHTSCGRCLDPIDLTIIGDVEGYFLLPDSATPEDMEGDEFEVLDESSSVDLESLLIQALLMAVPLVPLCKEDCMGLCPQCGVNWNREDCGCDVGEEIEVPDGNPFAVLLDIDFKDE